MSLLWVRTGTLQVLGDMKQRCSFPLPLISSCCADRVNEEYRGEKGPKDRRGNQAPLDWISLVPWYVFHFTHPKHGLRG